MDNIYQITSMAQRKELLWQFRDQVKETVANLDWFFFRLHVDQHIGRLYFNKQYFAMAQSQSLAGIDATPGGNTDFKNLTKYMQRVAKVGKPTFARKQIWSTRGRPNL